MSDADADFETLLADAEESVSNLAAWTEELGLEGEGDAVESLAETVEQDELESILEDLDALADVVDEAEDVLETIDFAELADAIDPSAALEAIRTGEIPEELAADDTDLDDLVKFRTLLEAINLTDLWRSVDLRAFKSETDELDEATDELDDEVDDGGMIDTATDAVGDDDEGMIEDAVDDFTDGVDTDEFGRAALEDGDMEEYQVFIQEQAMEGIEEFREGLLRVHGRFQDLYEYNRERMRRTDRTTNSRNPTAVPTMPVDRGDVGGATGKHSTVPKAVRHSTAPGFERIYARRYERELEKRREGGG